MRRIGQRKKKESPEVRATRAEWKGRKRAAQGMTISDALYDCPMPRSMAAGASLRDLEHWKAAGGLDAAEDRALDKLLSVTARARWRAWSYDGAAKPTSAKTRRHRRRTGKRLFAALRSGQIKIGPVVQRSMYPGLEEARQSAEAVLKAVTPPTPEEMEGWAEYDATSIEVENWEAAE